MYERILIPTDGSKEAERGIEHGVELAAALGATVHALYVIDLPGTPRTVSLRDDEEEMREEYQQYGEEVTNDVAEQAAAAGVECVTVVKTGSPSEKIVDYAEEEGMDAIVLGSAYRGKFRALLGSTADKVVRASKVPVITTRAGVND